MLIGSCAALQAGSSWATIQRVSSKFGQGNSPGYWPWRARARQYASICFGNGFAGRSYRLGDIAIGMGIGKKSRLELGRRPIDVPFQHAPEKAGKRAGIASLPIRNQLQGRARKRT